MTNRILIGNLGGGVQGIKVSKPGYDVFTAADENMLVDSRYGLFRIINSYQFVFDYNTGPDAQTIAHGLGYSPAIFYTVSNFGYTGYNNSRSTVFPNYFRPSATSSNINVSRDGPLIFGTVTVNIFGENI